MNEPAQGLAPDETFPGSETTLAYGPVTELLDADIPPIPAAETEVDIRAIGATNIFITYALVIDCFIFSFVINYMVFKNLKFKNPIYLYFS